MASVQRPRVIYIAGYGRSGSTILDIILDQSSEVFGAGEVTTLARHVWSGNEYCACGAPIRDCPVWSAIVDQWLDGHDASLIERYSVLQHKFESITGSLRLLLGIASRKEFSEYAEHTSRLFNAIAAVTGATAVIDSSKLPGRAHALARVTDIDLYVIHLVRDGRAVAWSLLQRYDRDVKAGLQKAIRPKSTVRTSLRWAIINAATEWLCRRLGPDRSTRVCYENVTTEPAATLQSLGVSIGIDLDRTGTALERCEPIRPGHQMAGNRLRMKGETRLIQDSSWRIRMPAGKQATVSWLCGWMLQRYGYSRVGVPSSGQREQEE